MADSNLALVVLGVFTLVVTGWLLDRNDRHLMAILAQETPAVRGAAIEPRRTGSAVALAPRPTGTAREVGGRLYQQASGFVPNCTHANARPLWGLSDPIRWATVAHGEGRILRMILGPQGQTIYVYDGPMASAGLRRLPGWTTWSLIQ